jgi:hypothetical protein
LAKSRQSQIVRSAGRPEIALARHGMVVMTVRNFPQKQRRKSPSSLLSNRI